MTLLIIGSEGFIGKHIVTYFSSKKINIIGLDLLDVLPTNYTYHKINTLKTDFAGVLETQSVDVVINAAGSGNVPFSMTHPVKDFEANVQDTICVLEAIRLQQPQARYIHISSAAVYGNPQSLPIKESDNCAPLSPYGWHKYMSEFICKEYSTIYGLDTAVVRPFSVYGPGLRKQLFWDLYEKVKSCVPGDTVTLWGTGHESRDYIYIKDLVNALASIISIQKLNGAVFNLASGVETTIKEAVDTFLTMYKPDVKIVFNNQVRQGDPLNWKADITALRQIGYTPQFSFEEGVIELVDWIKSL